MLWSKNANFFVCVDLVRIRLKIMLTDFAQEKETFLTTKNNFSISKSKNAFFSLFTFDDNKIRNNAWRLCRRKKAYFDLKKKIFQSPKNRTF